jgi:predicted HTH transcriptional regulator
MNTTSSPFVFDKVFYDIAISDLESLITNEVTEGLFIEYKRAWPENQKVARSVCSFANAHGGYLIIGIRADKDHNKPVEITGIDLEEGLNDRVKNIVLANWTLAK